MSIEFVECGKGDTLALKLPQHEVGDLGFVTVPYGRWQRCPDMGPEWTRIRPVWRQRAYQWITNSRTAWFYKVFTQ